MHYRTIPSDCNRGLEGKSSTDIGIEGKSKVKSMFDAAYMPMICLFSIQLMNYDS